MGSKKVLFLIVFAGFLFSCRTSSRFSLKPHAGLTGNLVEVIYNSSNSMVFFCGPLLFKDKVHHQKIIADFTELIQKDSVCFVDIKFTVITRKSYALADSFSIIGRNTVHYIGIPDTMFLESDKKMNKYRFIAKFNADDFDSILKTEKIYIDFKPYGRFESVKSWKRFSEFIFGKLETTKFEVENSIP